MGKRKAKVSLKVKGSPEQVRKAVEHLADAPARMLREADFRIREKKGKTPAKEGF